MAWYPAYDLFISGKWQNLIVIVASNSSYRSYALLKNVLTNLRYYFHRSKKDLRYHTWAFDDILTDSAWWVTVLMTCLGLGVSYDAGCSTQQPNMSYVYNTTDNVTDVYPCEFGFHYLEVSGSVWLALLPFWICALFGNCWRQCCCCCCDPIVIGSTIIDFIQVTDIGTLCKKN